MMVTHPRYFRLLGRPCVLPLPSTTRLGLSALAGSIGIQRGQAWERRWAFNLTLATNWFDLPGPQFLLMRMFGKMLTALKNSVAHNR